MQDVDLDRQTFNIDNVEIERRQTNEKTDLTVCLINISNDDYLGEIEATLTYEYYDQGGWILDDWSIDSTAFRPLKGVSNESFSIAEAALLEFYPHATLVSHEIDLDGDLPTEVWTYEIPGSSFAVGDTGIELNENGIIKIEYTFIDYGAGPFWNLYWDLSSFSRDYTHYQKTWNRTGPKTSGRGSVYFLMLNDISPSGFLYSDMLDITVRYEGSSTTSKRTTIPLIRCTPGTTINDIINKDQCPHASIDFSLECFSYGFMEIPKYLETDPAKYTTCIMFTEDGLYFFGNGELATRINGDSYTWYSNIRTYE